MAEMAEMVAMEEMAAVVAMVALEAMVEMVATGATEAMAETQVQEAQVAMEVTGATGAMEAVGAILRIDHLERAASGRSRLVPPITPRITCRLLQQQLQSLGSPHPLPQVATLKQMKRLPS